MADFLMPSLGADMDEGTVLEWRVKPGDQVRKGDIVAVVDTDKAAIEVESFSSGTVRELLVQPGSRVPVGTVLATIGPREAQAAAGRAGVSSPLVRHLADERGVDLAAVRGTGADGQVTRADVTRAAGERPAPRPAAAPAPAAPAPAAAP
ncbi:MAG: E3 binding domain-containing protein, partial [Actinomycetota bacterium]|nr:E3 binding domain-containing protein [Actinomycetota bacterium]